MTEKTIFHRHENKYHIFKNGVEYIVRAHNKKTNLSLVNAGKMKRLVNSSKNFMILMIKPENDIDYEVFDGYNLNLKTDLVDVLNQSDEMFQESKGLLPRGESNLSYSCNKSVFFLTLTCTRC